jgi:hypothetical protein
MWHNLIIEDAYSATAKTAAGKEYQLTGILAKGTDANIVKLSCGTTNPGCDPCTNIHILELNQKAADLWGGSNNH